MNEPQEQAIFLVIPLEPPSVNHYKNRIPGKYQPDGRQVFTISKEARAFLDAIAIFARGQQIDHKHKHYRVEYCVFQGKGSKGDIDNYAKCILDGLVRASVIKSDAGVIDLHMSKRRDPDNPRTEIRIYPAEE